MIAPLLSMRSQVHIHLDCQGGEKGIFAMVRKTLLWLDLLVKEEDLRVILLTK